MRSGRRIISWFSDVEVGDGSPEDVPTTGALLAENSTSERAITSLNVNGEQELIAESLLTAVHKAQILEDLSTGDEAIVINNN